LIAKRQKQISSNNMNYPRTRLFLTAISAPFWQHQHPALLIGGDVTTDADALSGPTSDIANLTGEPWVVIPHGGSTSLSIIGRPFGEATILQLAKAYQEATTFHPNRPPGFVQ
jgi:Asp-tRNA(Asn)/Glu-tRNA(Gln) amidotransferase A subunit family amidase